MLRDDIHKAVAAALKEMGAEVPFVVERPAQMEHGDYATNAALAARVDARELAEKLRIENIERVEVVGKFINFFLSREAIKREIETAANEKEWGSNQLYKNKQVLVEYTSPNLFKPLHIGNLVGNVLGESVSRLFEASGAEVKRINYPSDIGLTVAKGVWGLQKNGGDPRDIKALGAAYIAGNEAYEDGSAKEEIERINKALYEDSDPQLSALRKAGVETSRQSLDALCEMLGTKFDREFFESEASPLGSGLVRVNEGAIFEKSDGAVVYKGEQDRLHTRVFLNSQGLPTYEAKDLGLFKLKLDAYPNFDISITDTGAEQCEYFKVLFAVARKVFPALGDKTLINTNHGTLKLTTGKMSSRKGNVITGESLIEDLKKEAQEKMRERELADKNKTAEQIAVGAIKYAVLKQGSGKDIIFDPGKSLSLEGDSGPYLQYARVRALSLLRKAEQEGLLTKGEAWPSGLERPESATFPAELFPLARLLIHYPDAVARAAEELEPHYVATYVTELAGAFNSWYASERVIGSKYQNYRVLLTLAVEQTLAKGLHVLGIPAPDEM